MSGVLDWLTDRWYYIKNLSGANWVTLFFFSFLFFLITYFFIYRPLRTVRSRSPPRAVLILIIAPVVFCAVCYGYAMEDYFHFREFVYTPFTRFLLGEVSWLTFGSFMMIVGLFMVGLTFVRYATGDVGFRKVEL